MQIKLKPLPTKLGSLKNAQKSNQQRLDGVIIPRQKAQTSNISRTNFYIQRTHESIADTLKSIPKVEEQIKELTELRVPVKKKVDALSAKKAEAKAKMDSATNGWDKFVQQVRHYHFSWQLEYWQKQLAKHNEALAKEQSSLERYNKNLTAQKNKIESLNKTLSEQQAQLDKTNKEKQLIEQSLAVEV